MTEQANSSLAVALAKAQGEMQNATINKDNPYFSSRYADLASIRDATVPFLSKHGLCIYHIVMQSGEMWVVRGILKHGDSGESIFSDFPVNVQDKPQAIGSAITYARRYTWAALCGVAAEEDDDANAASGNVKQIERKPQAKTNVIEMNLQEPKIISKTPVELPRGEDDWTTWGKALLDHIKQSQTSVEADEWMRVNGSTLDKMEKQVPKMHKRLGQAVFDVYQALGTRDGLS